MERTIAIANQNTQQRYTIKSHATTLGELQDEMTAQGIDFTGMEFTEGISKTTLHDRDSQLPSNVTFKGKQTNDLVMLLTNSSKKISSGADTRKEAYEKIKEYGLQETVKEEYGRNYTMVKTEYLWEVINNYRDNTGVEGPSEATTEGASTEDEKTVSPAAILICALIDYVSSRNELPIKDAKEIVRILQQKVEEAEGKASLSDEDINDIIAGI